MTNPEGAPKDTLSSSEIAKKALSEARGILSGEIAFDKHAGLDAAQSNLPKRHAMTQPPDYKIATRSTKPKVFISHAVESLPPSDRD